jgi:hypothetical protein
MKRSLLLFSLLVLVFTFTIAAQKKTRPKFPIKKSSTVEVPRGNVNKAVVVDERLAVLRIEPSLYAKSIQRMRAGRLVSISGVKEADGVTFYRVVVPPNNYGWVQSQAVFAMFRRGDDERLARLVQSTDGFEQIERAELFLENFPNSPLRPAILLLTGDIIEEAASKMSLEATRRLDRKEMTAAGAPLHSFYLNYVSLDRYRKLGINFVFNSNTKTFHYDGATWKEIVAKFPTSSEVKEAQKRLDSLKEKLERVK